MNEEVNEGSSSLDGSSDLTIVVDSMNELIQVMQEQQEQKVLEEETKAEEEKTTNELLEEINTKLEEQQSTEEETEMQTMALEAEQDTMNSILEQLILLNENITTLQQEMPKEKIVVEGFFYVGLSVVIAFAVYMFWNQLSKW